MKKNYASSLFTACFLFITTLLYSNAFAQVKLLIDDFEGYTEDPAFLASAGVFTYGSMKATTQKNSLNPEGYAGNSALQISWQGNDRFGGWGKGLGAPVNLDAGSDYLHLFVYSPENTAHVKLEVLLEEDDNGNGTAEKELDDVWRTEVLLSPANNWQKISISLSAFKDHNAGGDGIFNVNEREGSLLTFIINFPDLSEQKGNKIWHFGYAAISKGLLPDAPTTVKPSAASQQKVEKKPVKDWQHMGDAFRSSKLLLGKKRLEFSIGYSVGRFIQSTESTTETTTTTTTPNPRNPTNPETTTTTTSTTTTNYEYEFRNALVATSRIRLFEDVYMSGTFFKNFNPNTIEIWTADYYYALGRYNWRPNTFSYGYENFMDNRYNSPQSFGDKFLQGSYFVSYGHELPKKLKNAIKIDNTSNIQFNYFLRYAAFYRDATSTLHGGIFDGKPVAGIAARYTIAKNIFAESAIYHYFNPDVHKMSWDPDYTYGFGYFDYRSFRLSLTYANWVVNRFPWNPKVYEKYGILDGDLRLTLNIHW